MNENVIAYKIDGEVVDTQSCTVENATEILYDNSDDALSVIRHSTAHLMAQAITDLYDDVQFFVGPVIEDGFYYDFRIKQEMGAADLKAIEKQMKKLIKKKYAIEKSSISYADAQKKFANDDLKMAVMKNIPEGEAISVYTQGNFEDLCRGPHVPNTKWLHNFKLTRIAGAYLGGNSDNEMITRVYGTAFADKESLNEYLAFIEEALLEAGKEHSRIERSLRRTKQH